MGVCVWQEWPSRFAEVSYEVGGDVFSLQELEHCVLRGKLPRPSLKDFPKRFAPLPPELDDHYAYRLGKVKKIGHSQTARHEPCRGKGLFRSDDRVESSEIRQRKERQTVLPVVGILRARYAYRLGKVSNFSVILRPPGTGLVGARASFFFENLAQKNGLPKYYRRSGSCVLGFV